MNQWKPTGKLIGVSVVKDGKWQPVPRWRWFQYGFFTQSGRLLANAISRVTFR